MGAQGVGLLRTEFLLTGRAALPTETEQADYFRRVATAFHGHTVIIRSYDLGGDKFPVAFKAPAEANPFLGWRSIRVCLDEPDVSGPRSARCSARRSTATSSSCCRWSPWWRRWRGAGDRAGGGRGAPARRRSGGGVGADRRHDRDPGGGADRRPAGGGERVLQHRHQRPDPVHPGGRSRQRAARRPVHARTIPSIVRQLHSVLQVGRAAGIPVSVCGEMASEPLSAVLLLGLGYRPAERLAAGASAGQVGGPHRAGAGRRAGGRIRPGGRQRGGCDRGAPRAWSASTSTCGSWTRTRRCPGGDGSLPCHPSSGCHSRQNTLHLTTDPERWPHPSVTSSRPSRSPKATPTRSPTRSPTPSSTPSSRGIRRAAWRVRRW